MNRAFSYTYFAKLPDLRKCFSELLSARCFSPRKTLKKWLRCDPRSICATGLWLVRYNDKPVAVALRRYAQPNLSLFVKPAFRRLGIGTKLVELCSNGPLTLRSKSRTAQRFVAAFQQHPEVRIQLLEKLR